MRPTRSKLCIADMPARFLDDLTEARVSQYRAHHSVDRHDEVLAEASLLLEEGHYVVDFAADQPMAAQPSDSPLGVLRPQVPLDVVPVLEHLRIRRDVVDSAGKLGLPPR